MLPPELAAAGCDRRQMARRSLKISIGIGPGQVLALAEGAHPALIDADRRVDHLIEEVADRVILGEEWSAPSRS